MNISARNLEVGDTVAVYASTATVKTITHLLDGGVLVHMIEGGAVRYGRFQSAQLVRG